MHYTGWTTDGKMFDSSYARDAASTFPVNQVIKGWGEGVQLMTVGEKRRLWIPQELAYAGQAGRPQGMLVFDVELLEIVPSPETPPPTSPPCQPTRRRRHPVSPTRCCGPAQGRRPPHQDQPRHRALLGLDHRRQAVRQLADARPDRQLRPRRRHRGLDRGPAADGAGREDALLDSRNAWPTRARATGPKGMLVFDVELLSATVGR